MEGETQCSGSRLSENVTTACLCGDRMKMSLPLLPGSHLGQNFGPKGNYFALVCSLAYSLLLITNNKSEMKLTHYYSIVYTKVELLLLFDLILYVPSTIFQL